MLQVPRLDDLDYSRLMSRARAMAPEICGLWTDVNDHDPGITTLQTFAWLYDTLNYYLNATGEVHRLKYLKLLGLSPNPQAAFCHLALQTEDSGGFNLPKGSRFYAGDIPFETERAVAGHRNRLLRLYSSAGDTVTDRTAFAGIDGQFAPVMDGNPTKLQSMYMGFERPLYGETRFFVEIEDCGRNPFPEEFSMTKLLWESFDGSAWRRVAVEEDETCGLLRSGYLTLRVNAPTQLWETEEMSSAYYVRCSLIEGVYDLSPRIGRVVTGSVSARQTETLAQAMEFPYNASGRVALDRYFREGDVVSVAVEGRNGYVEWYGGEMPDLCRLVPGDYPWQRVLEFDEEAFGIVPEPGDWILVTVTDPSIHYKTSLGVTDGCAAQCFFLDMEDVLELRLALVGRNRVGQRTYTLWDRIDELWLAGHDDKVFSYDAETQTVTLGDSINGIQPEQGLEVVAVTVKTSRHNGGNVLAGQVKTVPAGSGCNLTAFNLEEAKGGQRALSSHELEKQIEGKLRAVTRAVNMEDYRELVLKTPGLLIDSVAVISMQEYARTTGTTPTPNTVVVAVKPASPEKLPQLSPFYQKIIRKHLDKHRLITTDVKVVPAGYVGISVYGRIALTDKGERYQQQVLGEIDRLVNTVVTGEFGKKVDYGRLFSALELVDCVKHLGSLSLEAVGTGGVKNEHGDILVYPHSLSYLYESAIEFV